MNTQQRYPLRTKPKGRVQRFATYSLFILLIGTTGCSNYPFFDYMSDSFKLWCDRLFDCCSDYERDFLLGGSLGSGFERADCAEVIGDFEQGYVHDMQNSIDDGRIRYDVFAARD